MPIYEYECTNCQHHFDLIQKISDVPSEQCPQCFKNTAKRLISAVGFQLKGSGWYQTDFKNKGTAKKESTTNTENKAGEKKTVETPASTNTKKEGDKT